MVAAAGVGCVYRYQDIHYGTGTNTVSELPFTSNEGHARFLVLGA
jgi:hypothetical protein